MRRLQIKKSPGTVAGARGKEGKVNVSDA